MWEKERDGFAILGFGFSAGFETIGVDEDGG